MVLSMVLGSVMPLNCDHCTMDDQGIEPIADIPIDRSDCNSKYALKKKPKPDKRRGAFTIISLSSGSLSKCSPHSKFQTRTWVSFFPLLPLVL